MADAGTGRALRAYQLLAVLAIGWLIGRAPQLMADNEAEAARLRQSFGIAAPAAAAPDATLIASRVAAQVAAQVANETVLRLIAAGWGPAVQPQPIVIHQSPPGARPPETVVRVVTEAPRTAALDGYSLPPGRADARSGPPPAALPASPLPSASPALAAHATATRGYAALAAGDKRQAARLLGEAVAAAPDHPNATAWAADARRLTRRWSVAAYTLARESPVFGDALAASPILGGGQSGAAIAYSFDPLARRPVSAVARIAAASLPGGGVDRETTEAALGLRVQPFPGVPVALDLERRFALGAVARNAWAARVSGGTAGTARVAGRALALETYGEAGIVGNGGTPDLYAGAQGRGATPLFALGRVTLDAGAGAWGAAQQNRGATASRLDLGPSARFRIHPWPFSAQIDYRWRAAGNALPGSGPVLTVSGEF